MNFLLEMYRQCNEHLRHTDSKRDQLLAFYAAIVAIFFNAVEELQDARLFVGALFALVLFGLCIVAACINYWRWHFIYGKSLFVLRNLMLSHPEGQPWPPAQMSLNEEIERQWRACNLSLGIRTEFWIFTAVVVISALPVHVLSRELLTSCSAVCPWLLAILYIALLLLVGWHFLTKTSHAGAEASWFFRCLRSRETP